MAAGDGRRNEDRDLVDDGRLVRRIAMADGDGTAGHSFAQKEGRRACAEPRSVIWKGGDEEADGETTRRESRDGWNEFQLLARGRETWVSMEEEEEGCGRGGVGWMEMV